MRHVVIAVCDTAANTMSKASYEGQHQDITLLANSIQIQLVRGGLRSVTSTDWGAVTSVSQRLAAYAESNRHQFLSRARGEEGA